MTPSRARRQAILDAAYPLFGTQGFDKTSMAQIAARVGGSKATIYSHFGSKEQLLVECLVLAAGNYMAGTLALLDRPGSLDARPVLETFGQDFLGLACSPLSVAVKRLLIAEASRRDLGKALFAKLTELRAQVGQLLSGLVRTGALRVDDANLAATHLRALLESEILEPLLLNARDTPPDRLEIEQAAHRAVRAFLRCYGQAGHPRVKT